MFNLQFEEPYLSKAQEIMGRLCTEVNAEGGVRSIDFMESFLTAAQAASNGMMQLQNVKFGAENITEAPMPYLSKNQIVYPSICHFWCHGT